MSSDKGVKTLEQWRLLRGLSQRELAEKAKVDNGLISLIESGKRNSFRPKTMKAIADALGVTQLDIAEFAPLMEGKDAPVIVFSHTGTQNKTAAMDEIAAVSL